MMSLTMYEKVFETPCGNIHYWMNREAERPSPQLVLLPGLMTDHRLFDKQVERFGGSFPLLAWDAPGHGASWPFRFEFAMSDKARWLDGILEREGFSDPVIIGQSMGGYVGQAYAQLFPDKLRGFISIDSAPLQREYLSTVEIWLLKRMEPMYRRYPWKALLRDGSRGVASTPYGRELTRKMLLAYEGDKPRLVALAGHGFRIIAEAVEEDLPYRIPCPALLMCGTKDQAGACKRLNRKWHEKTGIPLVWIEGAGHNANTDAPEVANGAIEDFLKKNFTESG